MMDWPELRLRLALRLHNAWPFRVIAGVLARGVPHERGFGPFRSLAAIPTAEQIRHARACIVDAERPENSTPTQIDAAIQAIAFLDRSALADEDIQRYLQLKYERPLDAHELVSYHAAALRIAKQLLSNPTTLAAIKAAKAGKVTDVTIDDL